MEFVTGRRIGGEKVWYLSTRDAEQLQTVSDTRLMVPTADQAAGILQRHTLGVNEACAAMVRGAREAGDACGPLHWDLEVSIRYAEPRDGWLRADALLNYIRILDPETFAMRSREYAIELDRSHEPTDVLREKLRNYALALDYKKAGEEQPLWKQRWPAYPRILIVLGRQRQRQRRPAQPPPADGAAPLARRPRRARGRRPATREPMPPAANVLRDRALDALELQRSLAHRDAGDEADGDAIATEPDEISQVDIDEALRLAHTTQEQAATLRARAHDLHALTTRAALALQAPTSSTTTFTARRAAAAWLRDRAGLLDHEAERHRRTARHLAQAAGCELSEDELDPIPF